MIGYTTCAAALLALVDLDSVAAIRGIKDRKRQHGLRKLYYSEEHEVTDVQTECEEVIEGDPKQCIIVCVEVTSVKNGDELVGEYSTVNQRECEAGRKHDGHDAYDVDWEGHTEWPAYSPTQFPTFELADDGHDVDTMWTSDGRGIIDWTDNDATSYTAEILMAGGSKGSKSDGYSKGSNGGYTKISKSKSGKGGGQSKSSKVYYFDNGKGGGGSGYSKSSKSSGVGYVGDWDATILEPIHDESKAASWSGGAGIIEGDKVSSPSKSSKLESVSWSSGAGVIKEGSGSGSSKSSKSTAEAASWSDGVDGSSKSSKPQSASWSSGAAVIKEGSGSGSGSGSSKGSKPAEETASWSGGVSGSSKSSKPRSGSGSISGSGSGSGSSKSSKLVADSGEWDSAKRSGGGKVSGSSKSSKPSGGSADVLDRDGSFSDGKSGGWS
jgi:hypothetical protein